MSAFHMTCPHCHGLVVEEVLVSLDGELLIHRCINCARQPDRGVIMRPLYEPCRPLGPVGRWAHRETHHD